MKTKILSLIDEQLDGFIVPSQFYPIGDYEDVLKTIYNLIDKGILQKRNCEGTAYERAYNNDIPRI